MRAALFPVLVAAAALCTSVPVGAQPAAPNGSSNAADTAVANGKKPVTEKAIGNFVESYAMPSTYLGKLARWKTAVCPTVNGLASDGATVIAKRIRTLAAMIGAPVNDNPFCSPNVDVEFNGTPQKLLDDIRERQPYLVGYSKSSSQARRLATVAHPIQAWYATQWEDNNGIVRADDALDRCNGVAVSDSTCTISASSAGQRIGTNGFKSEFFNVLIVVDTGSDRRVQIDSLADYIAMLALAQTQSFGTCQPLPSITNLVSPNCDPTTKAVSLTDIDLAYLRGVYNARPDKLFNQQTNDIESEMAKAHIAE